MALIPDDTITEIRSRVDIVAVIGQHVQLRKAGRSWKGLCPFHGEKTPSFNVSPDKGFFYCFGCQKKGDAFTFVMEYEGKSFHEAAEQLAALAGVALPVVEDNPALRRARSERAQMLEVNKLATAFFRDLLRSPRGADGRAYLDKRRIGADAEERFQLGYGPGDWHALADHLQQHRVDMELAVKVGLVARQPRAGGFYDRFRDRLVCPVIVPGGEVVGFSARQVGEGVQGADGTAPAKYINSPESPVYKKSRLLFGLHQARESFRTKNRAVLVEGNFDVISMHQAGFTETVAPLGTALTAEQIDQVRRLADKLVLFYDGDKAGYRATISALELAFAADLPVAIARRPGRAGGGGTGALTDGVDPDTLVHAAGGPEQLAEMLDRAQAGIDFLVNDVWSKARTPEQKARAIDDAAKLLVKVADPTKRDLITGTLATGLQLDQGVVQRALVRAAAAGPAQGGSRGSHGPGPSSRDHAPRHPNDPAAHRDLGPDGPAPAVSQSPPPTEELELLCLLADHPNLSDQAEIHGVVSLLTDERLRDMYSASLPTGTGHSLSELAPLRLPPSSAQTVLAGRYSTHPDAAREFTRMVASLSHRRERLELDELKRGLADAKRQGDRELQLRLSSQVIEMSKTRKQVD